jgi:CO/xanthine dehydrogenase FAD-binding subunit
MLINLKHYHRPRDLQNALYLLRRPEPHTVPLAGGSALVGSDDRNVEAVVDLQSLGLRYISGEPDAQTVLLGAMATLADVCGSAAVRSLYGGILAEAAHRSAASVLRHQATVGGTVAVGAPADEFLVALLACDAQVTAYAPVAIHLSLGEFLARREELRAAHALITEVALGRPRGETRTAMQRVARTRADSPIVCAAAVLTFDGETCIGGRLALGGVADTVLRLPEVEAMLAGQPLGPAVIEAIAEKVSGLVDPRGDFRGSASYRKAMAGLLSARALETAIAQGPQS